MLINLNNNLFYDNFCYRWCGSTGDWHKGDEKYPVTLMGKDVTYVQAKTCSTYHR